MITGPKTLREDLEDVIREHGLEQVQRMVFELSGSKLRPTDDASKDRVVRARLGLRI